MLGGSRGKSGRGIMRSMDVGSHLKVAGMSAEKLEDG